MRNFKLVESRQLMDPEADRVVEVLFKKGFNPLKEQDYVSYQYNSQPVPGSFPSELQSFFVSLKKMVNPFLEEEIHRGLKFFDTHAQSILATLGLLSLPYCYAGEKGVKVLYFSERIRKEPQKRLLETGEFVFDVCNPKAFTEQGKAFVSIGKVRLMHAAIRYHLLHSGRWNSEAWDMPINQEDMAGTNLAFSLITVRGLRKLGFQVSPEEALSYITLWNWIGLLLGIDLGLMPISNQEAFQMEKEIAQRNFRHSSEGVELTHSLLDYFNSQNAVSLPVKVESLMSYLLGPKISKMLEVKSDPASNTFISTFKGISSIRSAFQSTDQWHATKRIFDQQKKQMNMGNLKPFRMVNNLTD